MWSKIILLFATLYVVNATLIGVDIDEVLRNSEPSFLLEDSFLKQGCRNEECDRRCHRLRYPGGTCVANRCRCDNYGSAEFSDLIHDHLKQSSCHFGKCDKRCGKHGYPGGACVNGRCKCNRKHSEEHEDSFASRNDMTCYNQDCEQSCRAQHLPGGVCIEDRCRCDELWKAEFDENITLDPSPARSKPACDLADCDKRCRDLKFPRGECDDGRCKCDLFRHNSKVNRAPKPPNGEFKYNESLQTLRNCNSMECNQKCRRYTLHGGRCIQDLCKCGYFGPAKVVDEDDVRRGCNFHNCAQNCLRLKFPGGTCVNERCKCNHFRTSKVTEANIDNPTHTEVDEDDVRRSCNFQNCAQKCLRRKFPGGTCVNERCKCNHFRTSKVTEANTDNPTHTVTYVLMPTNTEPPMENSLSKEIWDGESIE